MVVKINLSVLLCYLHLAFVKLLQHPWIVSLVTLLCTVCVYTLWLFPIPMPFSSHGKFILEWRFPVPQYMWWSFQGYFCTLCSDILFLNFCSPNPKTKISILTSVRVHCGSIKLNLILILTSHRLVGSDEVNWMILCPWHPYFPHENQVLEQPTLVSVGIQVRFWYEMWWWIANSTI